MWVVSSPRIAIHRTTGAAFCTCVFTLSSPWPTSSAHIWSTRAGSGLISSRRKRARVSCGESGWPFRYLQAHVAGCTQLDTLAPRPLEQFAAELLGLLCLLQTSRCLPVITGLDFKSIFLFCLWFFSAMRRNRVYQRLQIRRIKMLERSTK